MPRAGMDRAVGPVFFQTKACRKCVSQVDLLRLPGLGLATPRMLSSGPLPDRETVTSPDFNVIFIY